MAGYYTTDTLIEAIKRKALIPTSQSTFTNKDFLAFANEELKIAVVPTVLSLHEEFYVYAHEMALSSERSNYPIPYRATGGKLRDVFYKDINGNLLEMSRITPDDKAVYQNYAGNSRFIFYYVENNSIVLASAVGEQAVGSLVFTYFIRPNDLVEENRVAIITSISVDSLLGTTTYTVDKIPVGFSTSSELDLLQAKPGHKIRKIDLLASSINSTNKTITFNSSLLDPYTELGDHVSFSGECMIPQCPSDLHPVLAQRVAARCLEALGDTQGLTNANSKLQEMEMKTVILIDNRVDGSPQKVVNNRGLLGSAVSRSRRRW